MEEAAAKQSPRQQSLRKNQLCGQVQQEGSVLITGQQTHLHPPHVLLSAFLPQPALSPVTFTCLVIRV